MKFNKLKENSDKIPENIMDKVTDRYEKLCNRYNKIFKLKDQANYKELRKYKDSEEEYKIKVNDYMQDIH